eukprot:TRINITY_DN13784_c0_g1_i12.p2 TRINITY_DN13784_c0_g1~~TRINITY_DN13784_c0_g1_i12.p2  ORF type:complete len:216 (-),score=55.86 TRINITY_DN13784_c0_g1_i12:167-814(-)
MYSFIAISFFFFSSRRRHTRCREVSWARRCVQETGINAEYMGPKEEGPVKIESLEGMIDFSNVEYLNVDPKTPATAVLRQGTESLGIRSDTDPQLLFNIPFISTVKIHHIRISANADGTGPKIVKIFANRVSMGFSDAETEKPDQTFMLAPKDYNVDINFMFVKFQHIDNISIFVETNHSAEQTMIKKLEIHGCTAKGTVLKEFSKIQDLSLIHI